MPCSRCAQGLSSLGLASRVAVSGPVCPACGGLIDVEATGVLSMGLLARLDRFGLSPRSRPLLESRLEDG